MTFLEILNRTCRHIWGSTAPPNEAITLLNNLDHGIVVKAHRQVQEEYNYKFMEFSSSIPIITSTYEYALPDNFKELTSKDSIRILNSNNMYESPMKRLVSGEAYTRYRDPTARAEYPTHYEMWDEQIVVYPTPSSDSAMHLRYYQYFTDPRDLVPAQTFDEYNDELTDIGAELIIQICVEDICNILQIHDMAGLAGQRVGRQKLLVKKENSARVAKPELILKDL